MVLSQQFQKKKIFQGNAGAAVHNSTTYLIGILLISNAFALFYDLVLNLRKRHFLPEKWLLAVFMLCLGFVFYHMNRYNSLVFKYMPFLSSNLGKFIFYLNISSLQFSDSNTSKQSSQQENIQKISAVVIFLESLGYLFLHLFIENLKLSPKETSSNNNASSTQN